LAHAARPQNGCAAAGSLGVLARSASGFAAGACTSSWRRRLTREYPFTIFKTIHVVNQDTGTKRAAEIDMERHDID
jgi:hypothetical protein